MRVSVWPRLQRVFWSDKEEVKQVLWRIYSKIVEIEDGTVATRWFWRSPVMEGRRESPVGFTSREACVADATVHGYTPERESTREFGR